MANTVGTWSNGEIVVQNTSNAAGVVVYGNSTFVQLKNVKGTFVTSNTLYGYTSGTTANVVTVLTVRFSNGDVVVQANNGATSKVGAIGSNTQYYLANVVGKLVNNAVVYSDNSNAYATVSAISSYDGTRDFSSNFGLRFNQTSRVTLSSNTNAFAEYEFVSQSNTGARGRVVSGTSDLDIGIANLTGSFAIGDTLFNSNTSANAKIIFANSTYLRLTGVTNVAAFSANNLLNNGLSANAKVSNVYSVLILSDVTKSNNFAVSTSFTVTGTNSGATGLVSKAINPDLIRESGRVIYTEASNTVINRTLATTEEVRLVIKF